MNIPIDIPTPTRTWTHVDLMGREAVLSSVPARTAYTASDEFLATFPLLDGDPFFILSSQPFDALEFITDNVTKNMSNPRYQALMQAFGLWICKLNNSLGEDEATTIITDDCT